jgi:hypothetical protein
MNDAAPRKKLFDTCPSCGKRSQGSLESLERRGYMCSACWKDTPEGKLFYSGTTSKARQKQASYFEQCLEHYGTSCYCCGESNPLFLTMGHPNNDGAKHRREVAADLKTGHVTDKSSGVGGLRFYRYLVKHGFPTNYEIRTECFNCNCGAIRNKGICPHNA